MSYARKRNLYVSNSPKPYKLSRSKVDSYLKCPRCFYIDRKLGVSPPDGPPFTINTAVDTLLKKEFDQCREQGVAHPLMIENGINAIPFKHEKIEDWRNALHKGMMHEHKATNLILTGAIDDLWITPEGEIIIVDYKATSKKGEVNLDSEWQIAYKRQMDFYAWLFKQEGFIVSNTAFFVYANAMTENDKFDRHLDFKISVLSYQVNTSWVEETILEIKRVLDGNKVPDASPGCEQCQYLEAINLLQNRLAGETQEETVPSKIAS